ncbi:PAQR family membrane homeostasis protein TrhA [Rhodococcus sp. IEGM 1318]|uniref:PAQR family membrane homeostasis protein TrhA n=1 Tax=Rhodococcus sp. IEGM 1318 TaxID=3082226 RepID=UPI0029550AEE|nr:hemolysin III family protein [Rhodococcus sp. IEGM 1318]MDV8006292.1 hemolysin III family protein [Rhodococcus sp. IEGM 1318]
MTAFGLDELPVKPRMRGWIHLWALGVSVVAGVVLVSVAGAQVGAKAAWATAIYSITICGLFGISATYHRIQWQTVKGRTWMKRADHSMIFLFIAGSYTPFAMLGLPTDTGKIILAIVWAGALAGVALKMLWPTAPKWVGVPLYLLLGWAIVPVVGELTHQVGVAPMVLLLVGGIFYSVGAILYATKWPNPWPTTFGHHEFFHAATVVAAICHYIAVWLVVFN